MRCAALLGDMQKLQSSQKSLVFENSIYQITENHLQNKVTKLNETVIPLQNENKQMQTELIFKSDEVALKSKQTQTLQMKIPIYMSKT